MDSAYLIVALLLVIVFVRYDLMLFAVLTGFFVLVFVIIKALGRGGSKTEGPISAIREDLNAESKEVEHAHGGYPSGTFLNGVWNNFVDFLVGDRRGAKKEEAVHADAHAGGHDAHAAHGAAHGAQKEDHGGAHH